MIKEDDGWSIRNILTMNNDEIDALVQDKIEILQDKVKELDKILTKEEKIKFDLYLDIRDDEEDFNEMKDKVKSELYKKRDMVIETKKLEIKTNKEKRLMDKKEKNKVI